LKGLSGEDYLAAIALEFRGLKVELKLIEANRA
jgi:hypothetical protein